jgi:ParB-like chromosome segregation protein Spo0J
MTKPVKMAFNPEGVKISLDKILPRKKVKSSVKKTTKYRQIAASIREVGVVEHLVVYPQNGSAGNYMLLDGHLRFEILKEIGQKEVICLVSTDDEAFTFNHKVNRIAPIQEHFMILRSIEKGVLEEERIAKTLDVDIAKIRQKRNLLEGICSEVVELLKDKHFSPNAIRDLKKMKPMRQIEVAELMIAANNYTVLYAQALLAATPKDQLVEQQKPKRIEGLSPEEMARMEKETETLARDFKVVKDSYGKDTLNLVLACGYLSKLLDNSQIVRFLSKHYSDISSEFQQIIEATSLST